MHISRSTFDFELQRRLELTCMETTHENEPSVTFCQRMSHVLRPHPCIKLLRGDKPELESSLAQADIFPICGQRDLRRLVVSDGGIEGGDQHERIVEMVLDSLFVRLDPRGASLRERATCIGKE